jgi:hypothetical protein
VERWFIGRVVGSGGPPTDGSSSVVGHSRHGSEEKGRLDIVKYMSDYKQGLD